MTEKVKRFYDTSSLLILKEKALLEPFVLSGQTILELEHIKSSASKDPEIKYNARKVVRLLSENRDKFKVSFVGKERCVELGFYLEGAPNDSIILAAAFDENKINSCDFFTDDLLLSLRASAAGLTVKSSHDVLDNGEDYLGYKEYSISEEERIILYSNLDSNSFDCLQNEYLLLDVDGKNCLLKWDGSKYIDIPRKSLKTVMFGDKIKPKDAYQKMVVDSIFNNQVTLISGEAGSGKTLLSLVCAMQLVESGKYDRIVILFNPTSVKGVTQMGFYGGSQLEKTMQSFLGNVLLSKFGERYKIDEMINENQLKLVSMADSRGYEITDREILLITEFQNTNADIAKLCLTRVAEGGKVILEGDYKSQTDHYSFDGDKNGIRRTIDVLKGTDLFGYVNLKNVYRSRLADLVSKM